jgi:hypothetical protein
MNLTCLEDPETLFLRAKNFITTRNVVTTKPTQVNLLNVVNTQTFSELIHERLDILFILYILYTVFLINPTLIAFGLFTLLGLFAFLSKVLITYIFSPLPNTRPFLI